MKNILTLVSILAIFISSCKKKETDPVSQNTSKEVLSDYSKNICLNTYQELSIQTAKLYDDISTLNSSTTDNNLELCRSDWKAAREVWENSEAWLFGPVATENIDPRIDTWPVDFIRLDSVLNTTTVFNSAYINSLEESLKGFHPIEYLLFGQNGNKKASELTDKQKEYLLALAQNLKELTADLYNSWDEKQGNYVSELVNAGASNEFPTQQSAYLEIVGAMSGICDEVANGKIGEVLTNLDSMGEESPFAKNSITDFLKTTSLASRMSITPVLDRLMEKGLKTLFASTT
ncbi:MAG: imelysin family protein [Bacteroidia bacterium]